MMPIMPIESLFSIIRAWNATNPITYHCKEEPETVGRRWYLFFQPSNGYSSWNVPEIYTYCY